MDEVKKNTKKNTARELAMNTQGLLMDISAYICILKHSSNVVAQLT